MMTAYTLTAIDSDCLYFQTQFEIDEKIENPFSKTIAIVRNHERSWNKKILKAFYKSEKRSNIVNEIDFVSESCPCHSEMSL